LEAQISTKVLRQDSSRSPVHHEGAAPESGAVAQNRAQARGNGQLAFGHHEDRTPTHGYAATREAAMAAFCSTAIPNANP